MKVGTFDIEYIRGGTGNNHTLVFAHGLGGNLDQWKPQLQHFEKHHDVIAFSLQGHGNSSIGSQLSDYSIQKYCETVLQLLSRLNIKECIWIGNSMGGVIGFEVMKQAPTLIRTIIINGTTPSLKYSHFALRLIYIMDRLLIRILGYERYVNIAVKASMKDEEKMAWLKELFMSAHPEAVVMSHQLLGDYDYSKVIEETSTPIVFLKTPNDTAINKYLDQSTSWLSLQKNVTIEAKSLGGHLVNMEYHDEYNGWLKGYISTE
jgi:pimeloyl-ACP methyl ester carboxylesterase